MSFAQVNANIRYHEQQFKMKNEKLSFMIHKSVKTQQSIRGTIDAISKEV
jgi:hypothetical protein